MSYKHTPIQSLMAMTNQFERDGQADFNDDITIYAAIVPEAHGPVGPLYCACTYKACTVNYPSIVDLYYALRTGRVVWDFM